MKRKELETKYEYNRELKLPPLEEEILRVVMIDCGAHDAWSFAGIFLHYGNEGFKEAYRVESDSEKMILSNEDLGFETAYDEELEELSEVMLKMKRNEEKEYEVLGKKVLLKKSCY